MTLRNEGRALRIGLERRAHSFVPQQGDFELKLPPTFRSVVVDGARAALQHAPATKCDSVPMASARIPLRILETLCE